MHRELRGTRESDDHDLATLADGADRRGHHVFVDGADGDDRGVCTLTPGQFGDLLLSLCRRCESVCGAELHGGVTFERDRVDDDDVLGSGVYSALHRVDADAADAVDDHDVARADVARVDRRTPPGRHAAADEDGLVQRQPVVDLDHRVLADRRALAERAQHAHAAEVLAAAVEAERAVGQHAFEDGGAHVAQRLSARRAVAACAATRYERADHVIARLDLGDAGADLLDDARPLVAADHRIARRQVAIGEVEVGVAQARGGVLDQYLAFLGAVEVEFHDLEWLARVEQYGGFGFHGYFSL